MKLYINVLGMYEVAERFYQELIPQAREIAHHAEEEGKAEQAEATKKAILGGELAKYRRR